MAANGISTLQYKRDRQIAKLNLAAQKRLALGKTSTYELSELPTTYGIDDNNASAIVNNPNNNGLVAGRPWALPLENNLVTSIDNVINGTDNVIA
jgi:hypothetical protein